MDASTRLTLPLSFISCLGSSISVLALWGLVAGTGPGLVAFSVVFGIFSGGYSTLYAGMIRQVGSESLFPSALSLSLLASCSWLTQVSPFHPIADSPAQTATLYGVFAFVRGIGNVLAAPVRLISRRVSTFRLIELILPSSSSSSSQVSTALLQDGALNHYALGDFGKLVVFTGVSLFVGGLVPFAAGWKAKPSTRRD